MEPFLQHHMRTIKPSKYWSCISWGRTLGKDSTKKGFSLPFPERLGQEAAEWTGSGPGGPLPEELSRPGGSGRHGGHAEGQRHEDLCAVSGLFSQLLQGQTQDARVAKTCDYLNYSPLIHTEDASKKCILLNTIFGVARCSDFFYKHQLCLIILYI